jgi:hypothetical protein
MEIFELPLKGSRLVCEGILMLDAALWYNSNCSPEAMAALARAKPVVEMTAYGARKTTVFCAFHKPWK